MSRAETTMRTPTTRVYQPFKVMVLVIPLLVPSTLAEWPRKLTVTQAVTEPTTIATPLSSNIAVGTSTRPTDVVGVSLGAGRRGSRQAVFAELADGDARTPLRRLRFASVLPASHQSACG